MTGSLHSLRRNTLSILVQTALASAFAMSPAFATTFTVTSAADTGVGSLRAAVTSSVSGDTIVFNCPALNCPATITLSSQGNNQGFPGPTALSISGKSITIQGPFGGGVTLQAVPGTTTATSLRHFFVDTNASLTLQDLALSGGQAIGGNGGGGSYRGGGAGGLGGAILSQGGLTLSGVTFSGNGASGGAGGSSGSGGPVSLGGGGGLGGDGAGTYLGGGGGTGGDGQVGSSGLVGGVGGPGLGGTGGGSGGGSYGGPGSVGGGGGSGQILGGAGSEGGGGGGGVGQGGAGGFGGGGGAGSGNGGFGGFGGGGGLGGAPIQNGGAGGGQLGGGGAAFGGAVFARNGTLTIQNPGVSGHITGNSVFAGTGGGGGTAGAAAGGGLFLATGVNTTFDIAGSYTVSDTIADDSVTSLPGGSYTAGTGAGAAITKQGSGLLILSGADAYAGTTNVNNGLLRVTGSIAGSTVQVAAIGMLTGDGSTGAIDSFGTLVPGTMTNPQGGLTAQGLTLETGALSCFHALGSSNASSYLTINGAASVNGIARIDFAGGPSVAAMYTLLQATSVAGKFADFETNMPNLDGTLAYTATTVTFTVTASDVLFQDSFEQTTSDSPCIAAFAN